MRLKFRSRRARGSDAVPHFAVAGFLCILMVTVGCCLPQAIRATVRPYGTIEERALLKLRAKRSGREIWAAKYERCYANASHADDVKAGFEAAYVETALGMGNCPPPVPTRQSLALHGINRSYPCAVQWYEGYSLGHASAVANGVDRWRLAPLNPGLAVEQCHCQTQSLLTDQSIEHVITPELLESPVDSEPSVESLPAPDGMAPFLLEEFR